MDNDLKHFLDSCPTCEKAKGIPHIKTPIEITTVAEHLYEHTYIDYMGPLTPSSKLHKYIFVATCDLTKHVVAVACHNMTSITTADVLIKHIILRYNIPSLLTSDNASYFTSDLFTQLNKSASIDLYANINQFSLTNFR